MSIRCGDFDEERHQFDAGYLLLRPYDLVVLASAIDCRHLMHQLICVNWSALGPHSQWVSRSCGIPIDLHEIGSVGPRFPETALCVARGYDRVPQSEMVHRVGSCRLLVAERFQKPVFVEQVDLFERRQFRRIVASWQIASASRRDASTTPEWVRGAGAGNAPPRNGVNVGTSAVCLSRA